MPHRLFAAGMVGRLLIFVDAQLLLLSFRRGISAAVPQRMRLLCASSGSVLLALPLLSRRRTIDV